MSFVTLFETWVLSPAFPSRYPVNKSDSYRTPEVSLYLLPLTVTVDMWGLGGIWPTSFLVDVYSRKWIWISWGQLSNYSAWQPRLNQGKWINHFLHWTRVSRNLFGSLKHLTNTNAKEKVILRRVTDFALIRGLLNKCLVKIQCAYSTW